MNQPDAPDGEESSRFAAHAHVDVRQATADDIPALARLKTMWANLDPSDSEMDRYCADLRDWIDERGDALAILIAVQGDIAVGMAWMVIFERVPDFDNRLRLTADIQSVYVNPGRRGVGIGTRLVEELCREADRRGIPRTLVTASARSVSLYERAGFEESALLLQRPNAPLRATRSEPECGEPILPA